MDLLRKGSHFRACSIPRFTVPPIGEPVFTASMVCMLRRRLRFMLSGARLSQFCSRTCCSPIGAIRRTWGVLALL